MVKQIIQYLLENQGFVSSLSISNLLRQPIAVIEYEIHELNRKYPLLLTTTENDDEGPSMLCVKIAATGEQLAKSLLL